MQHCFFSHFSIHFFLRWRYSPFRLRRCLRILIRSWMLCNITRRVAISSRSETIITGHSSHMDAPKEQTLVRDTLSILFVAFQIRFSRLSLDDKNIDCALLSIESSGPGAEFSTCRRSKPSLLPLSNKGALFFRLKSTFDVTHPSYMAIEVLVTLKIFVRREAK